MRRTQEWIISNDECLNSKLRCLVRYIDLCHRCEESRDWSIDRWILRCHQTSNTRRGLVGNRFVDHADVDVACRRFSASYIKYFTIHVLIYYMPGGSTSASTKMTRLPCSDCVEPEIKLLNLSLNPC